jgi:hypothetical protein
MGTRRSSTAAAALLLLLATTACGSKSTTAEPAPVELAGSAKVPTVTIGLISSPTSDPGQGSDWADAAAGAEVAQYRYHKGATDVVLDVVKDGGTAQGAAGAVKSLEEAGVAGIVLATSGSHAQAAVDTASADGVALVAPYFRSASELPDGVWSTGVSASDLADALNRAVADAHASAPFVVTGDGLDANSVTAADSESVSADGDFAGLATRIAKAKSAGTIDCVVVAASAATEANVVRAIQGSKALQDIPVILTPEALSPVFGKTLVELGGTVSRSVLAVGPDAAELTAIGSSSAADRAAAFYAANRLAGSDPKLTSQITSAPFSTVVGVADIPSQDAVVALVTAAIRAGKATPEAVLAEMPKLDLTAADGLAGAPLDFGSRDALTSAAVHTLYSTGQDPSVRPAVTAVDLGDGSTAAPLVRNVFWFAIPDAKE